MSLRVTSRRVSGDSCSCVSRPGWPTGLELRPRSFMTVAMGVSGLVGLPRVRLTATVVVGSGVR